jgi:hypothetical protein
MTIEILRTLINFNSFKIGKNSLLPANLSKGIVESKSRKNLPVKYLKTIRLGSLISSPLTVDINVVLKLMKRSIKKNKSTKESKIVKPIVVSASG